MATPQDATKARLLEAAGEEFAEKGFAAARVRTICERAGANLAAVNYHFGDKEQLYTQAVLEAHRCGLKGLPDAEMPDEPPAAQLYRFIRGFLEHVLAMNQRHSWHHDLMMREILRPSAASEILVREAIRPRFEGLRRILARICPGAEARRLNALTFSVIGQCLHYRMARMMSEKLIGRDAFGQLDLDFLSGHIAAFSLAALGQAPPFGPTGEPVTASH